MQSYLPRDRGLDSPTFVMQPLVGAPSLYSTNRQSFEDPAAAQVSSGGVAWPFR